MRLPGNRPHVPRTPLTSWVASLLISTAVVLCGCGPGQSPGQEATPAAGYPTRPVTLICPWAAGGGTDRLSRFVADQLQQGLGKPVIVVNRTGGSGAAGHSAGALADPDGYTLTMGTFELSTMHWMGISPLTHTNFAPVFQFNADAAALIVRNDAPWQSLGDLLQFVKDNPGQLRISGTSTGGAWDLARAGFLLAAGLPVDSMVWVPTQGSAPSLVELLGGHIEVVCCSVPEAAPQLEAGQLRVLGVMAPARLKDFPDYPTVKELGVDWEAVGWRGLMLPKGAPTALLELLGARCEALVNAPKFAEFMKLNGFAIETRNAADFEAFLAKQDAQWKAVIEAAGYARP